MTHEKTPPVDRLAAFIENERKRRGWNYAEMGRAAGITKSSAGKIAHGQVTPLYSTIAGLARAFAQQPVGTKPLTMEQYLSTMLDMAGLALPDTSIDESEMRQLIQMMRTSPEAPVLIDVLERMPPDLRRQVLQTAQALLLQHETAGNGQAPRKS
jgi:transcriptional regulator with XRE-family HTH domain